MKKILSIIFLFALLTSGCSQDNLLQQSNSSDSLKFTASFEQNESRTYIDVNNDLHWSEDDEISLFYGNTVNQQYKFDGNTGDIKGTFSPMKTTSNIGNNNLTQNYAIYPYSSEAEISENGVIIATLPATQSYMENSFGLGANTMVAITENTEDKGLNFKNVGGYLRLKLYGTNVTVKSITLTGNKNEKLAGQATITLVYGQNPTISMDTDATNCITLDCGTGIKIGSTAETATTFWIVVPPTTFESGFTATITDVNDNEMTKSTSNEISIARNMIKPMETFEVETIPNNQIWYTSSNGNKVYPNFNHANITSNHYENGKGVITFTGTITSIEDNAFQGCYSLTNITIPSSVTTIGNSAFENCHSLTNINIPNSVTNIAEEAFCNCASLTNLNIPNSVVTIGEKAFSDCTSLTDITTGVKTIGNNAFQRCSNLTNVTLSYGVETIEDGAFFDCSKLTNITLSNSVTTIGDWAFSHCELKSFTIPNSVITIGEKVFLGCESLSTIIVEEENPIYDSRENCNAVIETTSNKLIYGCKNTVIPNSVTIIGDYAFEEADYLTNITFPNSVVKIGHGAFKMCHSLVEITIPSSVTSIENFAFEYCTSLSKVNVMALTPPTIYSQTLPLVYFSIYVPEESLNAYRQADYWKNYGTQIQGYNFNK